MAQPKDLESLMALQNSLRVYRVDMFKTSPWRKIFLLRTWRTASQMTVAGTT